MLLRPTQQMAVTVSVPLPPVLHTVPMICRWGLPRLESLLERNGIQPAGDPNPVSVALGYGVAFVTYEVTVY